jgi:hypothetical protein
MTSTEGTSVKCATVCREFANGVKNESYIERRNTSFGHLDKALDAAAINKWVVVDIKE